MRVVRLVDQGGISAREPLVSEMGDGSLGAPAEKAGEDIDGETDEHRAEQP
jgi:hypothetical protein